MDFAAIWNFIKENWQYIGAIFAAVWLVYKFHMQYKFNKKIEVIKSDLEISLEKTKAELDTNRTILNLAITSLANESRTAQKKRIKATEDIWNTTMEIRNVASSIVFFYSILLPNEYKEGITNRELINIENTDKNIDEYLLKSLSNNEIEKSRIFVGEKLWFLFWSYRAIFLRLGKKFIDLAKKGEVFIWTEDSLIKEYMNIVLDENEIEYIKNNHDFKKLNALKEFIEIKIINEIEALISGEKAATSSFENAIKFLKLVNCQMRSERTEQ